MPHGLKSLWHAYVKPAARLDKDGSVLSYAFAGAGGLITSWVLPFHQATFMKLYSYCLRYDDGAAPNPFWGICTLVVCKPKIRHSVNKGDWIVGLGSANSPIGDVSDCIVYAMKVTEKMIMREYDEYCRTSFQSKIPQWRNRNDYRLRVGDCIYDYSEGEPPRIRWSVHDERNRKRDLGGEYAVLSNHFFYFGDQPVKLPGDLTPIIHSTQGHKSNANQTYLDEFIRWIESFESNKLYGEPQLKLELDPEEEVRSKCAGRDLEDDENDELSD